MEICIKREPNDQGTPGKLYLDGVYQCFTLELRTPKDGDTHVKGRCCVPLGIYKVVPRFEGSVYGWMTKVGAVAAGGVPWIQNVDGVSYPKWINSEGILPDQDVLIHIGNKLTDTEGCLLVGAVRDGFNSIAQSTVAFAQLYPKILDAMTKKTLMIEYIEN